MAELGPFELEVGRRQRLANRIYASYGFFPGAFLVVLGALVLFGVGAFPRALSALFLVVGAGLVALGCRRRSKTGQFRR